MMEHGDYRLLNIPERAQRALAAHRAYVDNRLGAYQRRQVMRDRQGIPVLAFAGWSGAGKDTAAQLFCRATGWAYPGSVSMVVRPLVAYAVGRAEHEVFVERHQHRDFWRLFCDALRADDVTL